MRLTLTILFMLSIPGSAMADIYKCTTADGSLVFQQHPCPDDADEEAIEVTDRGDSDASSSNSRSETGSTSSMATDGSIVGTWVDVDDPDEGELIFSSGGSARIVLPGGMQMSGSWEQTGTHDYYLDLSMGDFDLSSDMTLNPSTGLMSIQMGSAASGTLRRIN